MEKKLRNPNKLALLLVGLGAGVAIGAGLLLLLGNPNLISLPSLWDKAVGVYAPPKAGADDNQAPDFTLQNLAGHSISLKEFRGRVVVLNFWATWCSPCRLEMPILQDYHERFSPDLVILGVSYQESQGVVQEFLDQFGFTYEFILDPAGVASSLYQVYVLPNTFIIERDGNIRFHHIGIISREQLSEYLVQVGIGVIE